jgi:hypothetical protein
MRGLTGLLLLLSLGCGGSASPPPSPAPVASDDRLSEIIAAALEADARMDPADSLYTPEAAIVADGTDRGLLPRYAGIGPGGAVAVTASRTEVRGGLAWAQVEYRWVATREGIAREGRVTFVLVPDERGAWRIRHAHSSTARPEGR